MFSDEIEAAAAMLSAKSGWSFARSAEYIENLIFNSSADIPVLLGVIVCGTFAFSPSAKGKRRGLRKAPRPVQGARTPDLPVDEPEKIRELRKEFRRRSFGIRARGVKDQFYGVLTRQEKRERDWKRRVRRALASEAVRPLKVR